MFLNLRNKSVAVIAIGLGMMQFAQAQAADATVTFSGQVTANTCTLSLTDGTNSATNGNLNVDFGKIGYSSGTATIAGAAFGTSKTVTLSAKNAAGTAACISSGVTGDKANFNVLLDLSANQITTVAGKTYRVNDLAATGTNAVLALAAGSTMTNQLNLVPRAGDTGTMAATSAVAIATGSIPLTAQLVSSTTSVSAGAFSASIPLFLVYQ